MKRKLSAILLVACGLAIGLVFNGVFSTPTPPPTAAAEKPSMSKEQLDDLFAFAGKLETLFHYAAGQVDPAVVRIESTQTVNRVVPSMPNPFGDMFPNMPGFQFEMPRGGRPVPERRTSLGSGMIIDKEGHILTNGHVVAGAQQLTVKLADGRSFDGEVVGTDAKTDLAVIKLKTDEKDFPTVQLGDSSKMEIGDWVLAVGSPFGLTQTVSAGIISTTGRTGIGDTGYGSMLQTDAAINPGNSGGPLINLHGEVIGINTAILSNTGGMGMAGNIGIGFAIPIDMAKDVLPDLLAGRKVVRGWLGIEIGDLTPELAEGFNYKGTEGVLVVTVMPDTPAEKAGLKAGDIITAFGGKPVRNAEELQRDVGLTKPGTKSEMKVWRDGKETTISVELGNQATSEAEVTADWLGVTVKNLTPDAAAQMGEPDLKGVLITKVENDSPAGNKLTEGMVIVTANRRPVTSAQDLAKLVSDVRPGGLLLLRVYFPQQQQSVFLTIRRPR
jgi:serine protease Do